MDVKHIIMVLSYAPQLALDELPVTIHFVGESGQLEATDTLKISESSQSDVFVFHAFEKGGISLV